jgi:hypothetical protein
MAYSKEISPLLTDEIKKKSEEERMRLISEKILNNLSTKRLLKLFKKKFQFGSEPCISCHDWEYCYYVEGCKECSLFPKQIAWEDTHNYIKSLLKDRPNI